LELDLVRVRVFVAPIVHCDDIHGGFAGAGDRGGKIGAEGRDAAAPRHVAADDRDASPVLVTIRPEPAHDGAARVSAHDDRVPPYAARAREMVSDTIFSAPDVARLGVRTDREGERRSVAGPPIGPRSPAALRGPVSLRRKLSSCPEG